MDLINDINRQILSWPGVTAHSHRFGGREFRYHAAEIGHVHTGGIVDIPFPRAIRDALIEAELTQKHHWLPDSGWTTFHVRSAADVGHALWLMRLSYLRYALKAMENPAAFFEEESQRLDLSPKFKALLELFNPKLPQPVSARAVPAYHLPEIAPHS